MAQTFHSWSGLHFATIRIGKCAILWLKESKKSDEGDVHHCRFIENLNLPTSEQSGCLKDYSLDIKKTPI
jgi:hypothetical protein